MGGGGMEWGSELFTLEHGAVADSITNLFQLSMSMCACP
jgi:hypothetical protein